MKRKVQLPKGFGKLPSLPKLSPALAEIFDKPINPNDKLPKEFRGPRNHKPITYACGGHLFSLCDDGVVRKIWSR